MSQQHRTLAECIWNNRQQKSLSRVRLFVIPWTIQSMEFSRPEYWSGQPFPSPAHLPNQGIEPRSPALRADSLPAEPQRKSKNTGVGSLSLLQWIFSTQDSNMGLLHCRWILYQLRYQGSPPHLKREVINFSTNVLISYLSNYFHLVIFQCPLDEKV